MAQIGKLWIFDELHKYRAWRNYLKGVYDSRPEGTQVLVTGSARLEVYRFGGDSLQGCYHLLRLHPFSAAELRLKTQAELGHAPCARWVPRTIRRVLRGRGSTVVTRAS